MFSECGLRGTGARLVKRAFDVCGSAAVLGLGWPIMVGAAAAVRASSPGPIFFVQERAGRAGKPFPMYKFRTMIHRPHKAQTLDWNKEEAGAVTRLGHFLRDYGLDELPQVINILKGDMSIIGPRPPLPGQAEQFNERERRMLEMRPGVLSLAAANGRRAIPLSERIEQHVRYVESWSLALDAKVLLKCAAVVLLRKNAVDRQVSA